MTTTTMLDLKPSPIMRDGVPISWHVLDYSQVAEGEATEYYRSLRQLAWALEPGDKRLLDLSKNDGAAKWSRIPYKVTLVLRRPTVHTFSSEAEALDYIEDNYARLSQALREHIQEEDFWWSNCPTLDEMEALLAKLI